MKLEVISRRPKGHAHPTPLLFVHGANSGAWIWDEHFLPFLAARGYEAHAVSLRGHGASEGRDSLLAASLRDYVDDVRATIGAIGRPPILIGHSMGGMVVQKTIEVEPVPGAVLMASVPPQGLWLSAMAMWMRNPFLYAQFAWVQSFGAVVPDAEEVVRRVLFSDEMPADKVREYHIQWQPESWRVIFDMFGWDVPRPHADPPPVLVTGGVGDVLVPPPLVELTARAYRSEPTIFENMAHAMMLEHRWQEVAEHLVAWLDAHAGRHPARTVAPDWTAANQSREPERRRGVDEGADIPPPAASGGAA
jgi:pimeloyl-ACP methyl ester carboxylesterase